MKDVVIVRYSEIGLKGKNRIIFERKLAENIDDCIKKNNPGSSGARVQLIRGRIIAEFRFFDELRNIFGISSISPAIASDTSMASIKNSVGLIIKDIGKDISFRVSVQRIDKGFKLGSMDLERKIGSYVIEKTGARVDLKGYDVEVGIEIIGGRAYAFSERINAFFGLPVGTQEEVYALVGDRYSCLAAVLAMKRGCRVMPFGTGKKDISLIKKFCYGYDLDYIEIGKEAITDFINKQKAKAIVTGRLVLPKKRKFPGLLEIDPLAGFNKKECDTLLEKYS